MLWLAVVVPGIVYEACAGGVTCAGAVGPVFGCVAPGVQQRSALWRLSLMSGKPASLDHGAVSWVELCCLGMRVWLMPCSDVFPGWPCVSRL